MSTCTTRALCLVACLAASALGFIDPKSTPVDLVRQSDTILVAALRATDNADEWRLASPELLKGNAAGDSVLDLAACKKGQVPQVRKLLCGSGTAPVPFLAATQNKQRRALLHVSGQWLSLKAGQAGRWHVEGLANRMSGVYAGGTDMLIRMTRYILAHPKATVPVAVGTHWMGRSKLATVEGTIAGLAAVELGAPRTLHLFVASDGGDRLFRPRVGEDTMDDVTAEAKLDTRSRRFAWVDMDRDGLADLVSWDGRAIAVRLLTRGGTFAPADPARRWELRGECLGLAPVSISADGAPAILVSTDGLPFLLERAGRRRAMPSGGAAADVKGRAAACVVADLGNDGFADVLQPREGGGVSWQGRAGGFEAPARCAVRGGPAARFALGDFDGDGCLDLFVSDGRDNQLWENDGKGRFRAVIAHAGSLSYKAPAGASACAATDLNHDGRPDLALCYADAGWTYHFNRGCRCFGEEGGLRLTGARFTDGPDEAGVRACAIADFNADGGLDLAVAFVGGQLYGYYNDLCDTASVAVRLKKGTTGAVTVSAWQGGAHPFCVGTSVVRGHTPPARLCLRRPGQCTLRYRLPGAPARSRSLTVGEETVTAVLSD